MTDYDSPWKEALDVYFQPFMALCFPQIYEKIDWSVPPRMLDKELMQIAPQSAKGRRSVDKLVEVKLPPWPFGRGCTQTVSSDRLDDAVAGRYRNSIPQ